MAKIITTTSRNVANTKRTGRISYLLLLGVSSQCMLAPVGAFANPQDGSVAAGSAGIVTSGNTLEITQHSQKAIIDWRSFDIADNEQTVFHQPNSAAVALNRIRDTKASHIDGKLTANGHVVLVNGNGVLISRDATIDVAGIAITTSDISNNAFMNDAAPHFDLPGLPDASIINEGTITAKDAGLVGLVGPQVENRGIISARLGKVQMASGDSFTLDLAGDGILQLAVTGPLQRQLVNNEGHISANGGVAHLTAAAARDMVDSLITNSGYIEAKGVGMQHGTIVLSTEDHGVVSMTGTADASGANGGVIKVAARNIAQQGILRADGTDKGGTVELAFTGAYIDNAASVTSAHSADGQGGAVYLNGGDGAASRIFSSGTYDASGTLGGDIAFEATDDIKLYAATLDASGMLGGGDILIGGDAHGGGLMQHADTTKINPTSVLRADALTHGIGGKVVVWSDVQTDFTGTITARGGAHSGDGGWIEISSHDALNLGRYSITDASAAHGRAGELLLDPKNLTVSNAGIASGGGNISYFELVDPNPDTGTFGSSTTVLSNGNVVIGDSGDDFVTTNTGAVYLFNGTTGALISTLTGSTANDFVGLNNTVTALTNGNYVVSSTSWDNGAATDAGAVTWGSGTTGVAGAVSSSNSLVGTTASDNVGTLIKTLTNGNYVVGSFLWDNGAAANAGAVTWGNGTTGVTGAVSSSNSLVGSTANNSVGTSITALTNGNYVAGSTGWDNGGTSNVGAVTWGSGTAGITGAVSSSNSLVGTTANDGVGTVTALTNGNYVVGSLNWDNGAATNAGALTWGNGTTGITGAVSSSNSLVGTTANDNVGFFVTALTNGNYVVQSNNWDNGAATNAGAVTWGDGTTGVTGAVSSSNSLVGSTTNDSVGNVTALTNGNYVVRSTAWDNGAATNAGAATWGNGTTGITGAVSSSNSLVGTTANDGVGFITALTNGNYVVTSTGWDNGAATNAGAATWGNGTTGVTGAVSSSNSLVGTTANDFVGGTITALTNGNYVVRSTGWDNGAATDAGAVTWGNGTTGITGAVSSSNSLVGTTANDAVGTSITALTNGNYVVQSTSWDNGAATDAGAVTWGNGTTGITGAVSSSNSLVGTTANDAVGTGITALTNGNYVVRSTSWDNGAVVNAGAVTWGNGTTGITGAVSSSNSLVGSTASDSIGTSITALTNGNYVVQSTSWDNGAVVNAGAATLCSGTTGCSGVIDSDNSLIGPSASAGLSSSFSESTVTNRFLVSFSTAQKAYSVSTSLSGGGLSSYDGFSDSNSADIDLAPSFITATLDAGTNVTLQANNDITVTDAITANNAGGDGGNLTFQAGRSILINANITTDNGDLTLYANETLANGVEDAHRDSGTAVITMASGTTLNAGTGAVDIQLKNGAGKTHTTAGDLTLRSITADSIFVQNANSSGDIILGSGTLTASGSATAITLVSNQNFINNAGSSALSAASGRWLVYSTNPASDTIGGLSQDFRRFTCSYGGSCPSIPGTGNGLLYSYTPTLTATPSSVSLTYGDAIPNLTAYSYALSGYLGSDSSSDNVTGSLDGSTTYVQGNNAASYNINYSAGTLTSAMGYDFSYANNPTAITVGTRALNVTADDKRRNYGAANPAFTASYTGFITGDDASVLSGLPLLTSAATLTSASGLYSIIPALGSLSAMNYNFVFVNGVLTIAPVSSTLVPASVQQRIESSTMGTTPYYFGFYNNQAAAKPILPNRFNTLITMRPQLIRSFY